MGRFVEVVIPRRQSQAGLIYLESKERLCELLTSLSLCMSTHKQHFVFIPVALRCRNRPEAAKIRRQGSLGWFHQEGEHLSVKRSA